MIASGREIIDVYLPLETSENEEAWRRAAADRIGVAEQRITEIRLRKHSIDARKRRIKVQLRVEVGT